MSKAAVSKFLKTASAEQVDAVQAVARSMVNTIMEKRSESLVKLAELEAEVAVHSTAAHLSQFKENMAGGTCWQCGKFPPSPASAYLRCSNCEEP